MSFYCYNLLPLNLVSFLPYLMFFSKFSQVAISSLPQRHFSFDYLQIFNFSPTQVLSAWASLQHLLCSPAHIWCSFLNSVKWLSAVYHSATFPLIICRFSISVPPKCWVHEQVCNISCVLQLFPFLPRNLLDNKKEILV
jgi:hypothetical protein